MSPVRPKKPPKFGKAVKNFVKKINPFKKKKKRK